MAIPISPEVDIGCEAIHKGTVKLIALRRLHYGLEVVELIKFWSRIPGVESGGPVAEIGVVQDDGVEVGCT